MKKRVFFVTGSRADYGLLRNLIQLFLRDDDYDTFVVATGAHVMKSHGATVDLVRKDVGEKLLTVDLEISGDRAEDISSAVSVGVKGFSTLYEKMKPDFVVMLGDRYELWSAAIPAAIFNLPIVHIHGGETTQGAIDEVVRHSLTKMSYLHLCAHESYRRRIVQMGEEPSRVRVVGAPGLDRIRELSFLSRSELEERLSFKFAAVNVLFTFHPVTKNEKSSNEECDAVVGALRALMSREDIQIIASLPNADTYSSYIRENIEKLVLEFPEKISSHSNLGDVNYVSLMNEVELVLGNSSSGIIEAPFLGAAVIDIGERQAGRLCSDHVLRVPPSESEILEAVASAGSDEFQAKIKNIPSLFGDGRANEKIYAAIRETGFKNGSIKKFYDGLADA